MDNAAALLHNGVYTEKKENNAFATSSPSKLEVALPVTVNPIHVKGKQPVYRVVEKGDTLTPDEWEQVVAVFVTGQEWHLKHFPWKKEGKVDTAQVFANVKAFHLHFTDDDKDKNVKAWKVHCLPIQKHERFNDRKVILSFWETLTAWLRSNPKSKMLVV
jgi:hypothetical protein